MGGMVAYPGFRVSLGGRELVVPALPIGFLEQNGERMATFADIQQDPALVIDIVFCALRRNYTDISREEVADMVDVANGPDLVAMILDHSGARRAAALEEQPGKDHPVWMLAPVAPAAPSTGSPSSPLSRSAPAGRSSKSARKTSRR